ncbi:MAG: DUF1365 domain-containing protein [Planctomycetota bacterium]|nr:MAG: DUF1365 domain-containing protein [Planctomycetota bacterium]REJ94148.1 MAG: DUF1365 domain-containing protein [Planctomycetota bacterium]
MPGCLYEGVVRHRRTRPVDHRFDYRIFMAYLDLDELGAEKVSSGLPSRRKFAPASFLRGDHLGPAEVPLAEAVRDLVQERTGMRLHGPVRLLTQLRYFGIYFSPLNLFYCFDEGGTSIDAIVAEVSNTPWNERYYYVLWEGNRRDVDAGLAFVHPKEFHVSPFMSMQAEYRWQLSEPGDDLRVGLVSAIDGEESPFFSATMNLERRPLSRGQLTRMLVRYPLMTARITTAVYCQALRLWLKNCPFFPHPNKTQQPSHPAST